MRALKKSKGRTEKRVKPCCICKHGSCVDEKVPKVIFKINPGYSGRITRSITKVLDHINDFILVEVYRCMPLIGDEDKIPYWDVHIVRYSVVFTDSRSRYYGQQA